MPMGPQSGPYGMPGHVDPNLVQSVKQELGIHKDDSAMSNEEKVSSVQHAFEPSPSCLPSLGVVPSEEQRFALSHRVIAG